MDWPPPLRNFVERSYAAADEPSRAQQSGGQARTVTEHWLRDTIAGHIKNGSLSSIDWAKEPVPAERPEVAAQWGEQVQPVFNPQSFQAELQQMQQLQQLQQLQQQYGLQQQQTYGYGGSFQQQQQQQQLEVGRRDYSPLGYDTAHKAQNYYAPHGHTGQSESRFTSQRQQGSIRKRDSQDSRMTSRVFANSDPLVGGGALYSLDDDGEDGVYNGAYGDGPDAFVPLEKPRLPTKRARREQPKTAASKRGGRKAPVPNSEQAKRAARFQQAAVDNDWKQAQIASQQEEWVARRAAAEAAAATGDDVELDWNAMTVHGTSTALEKPFLRLTQAPAACDVRPEPVLKQALEHIKTRYFEGKEYLWVWEQFKSIRQDLRVQHIRNEFAVEVYEVNSRLALRNGDLGEFNQCKSQLEALYDDDDIPASPRTAEIVSYWILYQMITENPMANLKLMTLVPRDIVARADRMQWPVPDGPLRGPSLSDRPLLARDDQKQSLLHALCLRRAHALGDYRRFFRLCADCPGQGKFLLEKFITKQRERVLKIMVAGYSHTQLEISWIGSTLGFTDDNTGKTETVKFLQEQGAVFGNDMEVIDASRTAARIR